MTSEPQYSERVRSAGEPAGVSVGEALAFLRAHLLFVLAVAAVAGAAMLAWTLVLTPTEYEASTMLTIRDLRGAAETTPVLPLPAYQRLLDSGTVKKHTHEILVGEGVLESGEALGAHHRLTNSFVSSGRNEPGNTALFELTVVGTEREKAAAVANAWAEAFVAVERRQVQLAELRETLATLHEDESKFADRQDRLAVRLEASERQLERIPQTVMLRSVGEELNPVYQEIATSVAHLRIDNEAVEPSLISIRQEIAQLQSLLEEVGSMPLAADPVEAGDSSSPLARALAIDGAAQVIGLAEPPERPRSVRTAARVVIAATAGAILALLVALAREAARGYAASDPK